MYDYTDFDEAFVRTRVAQFSQQVERRLDGSLTEEEFRPLRLMNGLYLQLHAYMLRVAIPYGTLRPQQMRQLAMIADRYDKGYGHFTTRQNIQFNWPKLPDVPAILTALADVEMHAIQTSGNCVRNVTADHHLEPRRARRIVHHPQPDVMGTGDGAVMRAAGDGDLELSRQELEFGVVGGPLAQQFGHRAGVFNLIRRRPGEMIRRHVAHAIARGLNGVHFDIGQRGQDGGHVGQFRPVELDVLPRGEMAIALVPGVGDIGQLPHLARRQGAVRDRHAQHIGVQLQIKPVHQTQRAKFVLRQ